MAFQVELNDDEVALLRMMCDNWIEGETESLDQMVEDSSLTDEELLRLTGTAIEHRHLAKAIREKLDG